MAILLILAVGQIDDSGWQSNSDVDTEFGPESAMRLEAGTGSIENASFYNSEYKPIAGDLESGYVDEVDNRGETARENIEFGRRQNLAATHADGDELPESESSRRSQAETSPSIRANSFWESNDLLLDSPLPAQIVVPTSPKNRFRRVDSWNVPIPAPLLSYDPSSPSFGQRGWAEQGGRRDSLPRRPGREAGMPYVPADSDSNRRSFIPDQYQAERNDIRLPQRHAHELNGDGRTKEDWLAVRHVPPASSFPDLKTMPLEKINLMFGQKETEVGATDTIASQNDTSASAFVPEADRKLWPFVLATGGLIASLAFNFYLGFIAWDIHCQYRAVVADLSDFESRENDIPTRLDARREAAYSPRPENLVSRRRSISI